jgi:CBS domain-containing protein
VVVYRMAEHDVTHLPVVERSDRTRQIGIVSLRDMLQARLKNLTEERHRERTLSLPFFDRSGAA